MEDFKQYLSEDPSEEELEAAAKIRAGLSGLRLEATVAQAAAERKRLLRCRRWMRLFLLAAFAIVVGAAVSYFKRKTPAQPQVQPQERSLPTVPPVHAPENVPVPPTKPTENLRENTVVDNRPTRNEPPPRFPAPVLRGENNDDPAQKALIDQVWYTDYPPDGFTAKGRLEQTDALLKARNFNEAYVQLQRLERSMPANDTLRFMKAYCLLEMGEDAEALTYFEGLESRHATWAAYVEWYQGLAQLIAGDRKQALAIFKKIAVERGHKFRKNGIKAVQTLQ